jgi:hypothetical protein
VSNLRPAKGRRKAHSGAMDRVIAEVLDAVERREWERLRLLLHPYLHWTDAAGATMRGRTNVMARLRDAPAVSAPAWYELRDGQVYRWREVGSREGRRIRAGRSPITAWL